jgi:hypothetical protein
MIHLDRCNFDVKVEEMSPDSSQANVDLNTSAISHCMHICTWKVVLGFADSSSTARTSWKYPSPLDEQECKPGNSSSFPQ